MPQKNHDVRVDAINLTLMLLFEARLKYFDLGGIEVEVELGRLIQNRRKYFKIY